MLVFEFSIQNLKSIDLESFGDAKLKKIFEDGIWIARGDAAWGGPLRVSAFWGDTILRCQLSKNENNYLFNIIANIQHSGMD